MEAGEALYGPRWQAELARDLSVADRTIRRWVAGTSKVPTGLYLDLLRLTQERAAALDVDSQGSIMTSLAPVAKVMSALS